MTAVEPKKKGKNKAMSNFSFVKNRYEPCYKKLKCFNQLKRVLKEEEEE